MNADIDILGAEAAAPVAPPRRNGELVFDAPWESRAFGAAVAMAQAGVYTMGEMRDLLIDEIDQWERAHGSTDDGWSYYARWLAALERLLSQRDLLSAATIDERMHTIALHERSEHDDAGDVTMSAPDDREAIDDV